jgi:peptide/nickel transport system substrate-binding protein
MLLNFEPIRLFQRKRVAFPARILSVFSCAQAPQPGYAPLVPRPVPVSPRRLLHHLALPALLALAWWSAARSTAVRAQRQQQLVVCLPGGPPEARPLPPNTLHSRDVAALVFEPLLSLTPSGTAGDSLASLWSWSQRVTLWFTGAEQAGRAAEHVRSLDADHWIRMGLDQVSAEGDAVSLRFSTMDAAGPDAAVEQLRAFDPLPIQLVRLEAPSPLDTHLEHFLQHAVEAEQVRRTWRDGSSAVEMAVCGGSGSVLKEMRQHFAARPDLQARVEVMASITALREPALDLRLRGDRRWHDGSPVTAADVAATAGYYQHNGGVVPGRDSFLQISSLRVDGADRVQITYRHFNSALLAGWTLAPLLQAQWLEQTADGANEAQPPGTGPFRPFLSPGGNLILDAEAGARTAFGRLRLLAEETPRRTLIAYATGVVDVFHPEPERLEALSGDPEVTVCRVPADNRLLVLWNTTSRKGGLSSPDVREALGLALNRAALIQETAPGGGMIYDGLFTSGTWFAPRLPALKTDRARAADLLSKAGWLPSDADDPRHNERGGAQEFELLTTAGDPGREHLARLLAEQWLSLGVSVRVTALPWDELFNQRLMQRRFDAVLLGLDLESEWDQSAFWHSSRLPPRGLNFGGLNDRTLDLLLEAVTSEFDTAQLPRRVAAMEERLRALHAWLPLFAGQRMAAVRPALAAALEMDEGPPVLRLRRLALGAGMHEPEATPPPVRMREPSSNP